MSPEAFETLTADISYQPKGLFYSELYLLLCRCQTRNATDVIESGVRYGMSTRVLAAVYPDHVVSIDRSLYDVPDGVRFVQGDGRVLVIRQLEATDGRVAVLLDGPKGPDAQALRAKCLRYPQVVLVAVHDSPRGLGEQWHSHDPSFRASIGRRLDQRVVHAGICRRHPDGPGLGIWESAA